MLVVLPSVPHVESLPSLMHIKLDEHDLSQYPSNEDGNLQESLLQDCQYLA
jgi:hypothetical protein